MVKNYDLRGKSGFPLLELINGKYRGCADVLLDYSLTHPHVTATMFITVKEAFEILSIPFAIEAYDEMQDAMEDLLYIAETHCEHIEHYSTSSILLDKILVELDLEEFVEDDILYDFNFDNINF